MSGRRGSSSGRGSGASGRSMSGSGSSGSDGGTSGRCGGRRGSGASGLRGEGQVGACEQRSRASHASTRRKQKKKNAAITTTYLRQICGAHDQRRQLAAGTHAVNGLHHALQRRCNGSTVCLTATEKREQKKKKTSEHRTAHKRITTPQSQQHHHHRRTVAAAVRCRCSNCFVEQREGVASDR